MGKEKKKNLKIFKTITDKYGNKIIKIKLKDIFENIPGCWICDLHQHIIKNGKVIVVQEKTNDCKYVGFSRIISHDDISKIFKWDLDKKVELDVTTAWEAERSLNIIVENEVKKKIKINSFDDIIKWNYKKQGLLFLDCGEIENLVKDSVWPKADMYIECSKETNGLLKYLMCFA